MLKFFEGVPSRIMFDNSTSMVVEASRHVPVVSQDEISHLFLLIRTPLFLTIRTVILR